RKHAYMQQSLQPFGLGEVRFLKRFERVLCENLLLPSHLAVTGNYNQLVVQRLYQRYNAYLAETTNVAEQMRVSEFGERVYISRRMATRRRIANEEAILP